MLEKLQFHYKWQWDLEGTPEMLWPFVADTDRFGVDTWLPSLHRLPWPPGKEQRQVRNRRHMLKLYRFGVPVEWEEEPFEWVKPRRFGVLRRYRRGPIKEMLVRAELTPLANNRTHLVYEVWARPHTIIGLAAVPGQIGILSGFAFARAFKTYSKTIALGGSSLLDLPQRKLQLPGFEGRIESIKERLAAAGVVEPYTKHIAETIMQGDDFNIARLQPYALAERWGTPRKQTLEACLLATRAGVLDLRWDVVCPSCRGAKASSEHLADVRMEMHCDTCMLNFKADFDRLIEITFRPNPAVREIHAGEYCVGGPQITPHIVAQQLLAPGETREISMPLETGMHRVRAIEMPGIQMLRVAEGAEGESEAALVCGPGGWAREEITVSGEPLLKLVNATEKEQLFIIERTAWSDRAATAAEVTTLQSFRDLFSHEALRPGEQVWVGALTVLFTDLRDSTSIYRRIGDAPAFGRVMSHFDVLKEVIDSENGALVKTIGDAVMAVFRRPADALRAALEAQARLRRMGEGEPEQQFQLKVGIHTGSCIAVTLNERLDYFGTTINIAARLEDMSSGRDVIISGVMCDDPEVAELIAGDDGPVVEMFDTTLKGFGNDRFRLWRVYPNVGTDVVELPALNVNKALRV